ncbi:hypothetical protein KR009_003705 [Drosophila setifemur]|nr:hypothetical protein KR009_003705 [Drosophila setifemur]
MNRRMKRTSYQQYEIYLDTMEANPLMAANRLSRYHDQIKWKELSNQLNKCPTGPSLNPEDWRKVSLSRSPAIPRRTSPSYRLQRLNDWKNTTRSKYRRSLNSGEKNISTSQLENRALEIFYALPMKADIAESEEYLETEEELLEEQDEQLEEEPEEFQEELQAEPIVINGQGSNKRMRISGHGQIIYEVTALAPIKNPPRDESPTNYVQQIENQLKRISDIQEASLQFKIARFKYNNPGFEYIPEL